jgi:hypothetical protein
MPPPQGDSGRVLCASMHRRTGSGRHVRWHARRRRACGAVEAIAGDPERVEESRMDFGRSLSLLERVFPVSQDSIGKSGRIPEQ